MIAVPDEHKVLHEGDPVEDSKRVGLNMYSVWVQVNLPSLKCHVKHINGVFALFTSY